MVEASAHCQVHAMLKVRGSHGFHWYEFAKGGFGLCNASIKINVFLRKGEIPSKKKVKKVKSQEKKEKR